MSRAHPLWGCARIRWRDVVAGLSIAGLLLPEAVAYSSIGNLPPQAGIIALFAGLIGYGVFGRSRFAIVSATSSSAVVLAAATASIADGDMGFQLALAMGLVLVTGLFFLLAGLARMGNLTDFIAKPVLRGFTFGLAIVIIVKQFASVVGVPPSGGDMPSDVVELLSHAASWNLFGLALGASALLLLFLLGRFRNLPAGLIVIVLGVVASQSLNLPAYGIRVVGPISMQLAIPAIPQLSLADWLRLGELGMAMVLILYSESYGSIRGFAVKHGDPVSPNRDLLALGVCNVASGLFHGMPVGAGYSGTSANEAAGAVSRWAGWVAVLVVLVLILALLPSIALLPEPVLAAIVIHAVSHTLRPAIFRPYFAWRRDRLLVIASVLGVLSLGVLDGLLAAMVICLVMLLRRLSDSTISTLGRIGQGHDYVNIARHPEARPVPGMIILRPDEPLFFANAERILAQARHVVKAADPSVHTLILSLEESPDLDGTSLEALLEFFTFVSASGRQLMLARLKDPAYEALKRAGPPGEALPFLSDLSVDDAVRAAQRA